MKIYSMWDNRSFE